jgi:chromosome segregation ATPase
MTIRASSTAQQLEAARLELEHSKRLPKLNEANRKQQKQLASEIELKNNALRSVEELRQKLADAAAKLEHSLAVAKLQSDRAVLDAESKRVQSEINDLQNSLTTATTERAQTAAELEKVRADASSLRGELGAATTERAQTAAELKKVRADASSLRGELGATTAERAQTAAELEKVRADASSLRGELGAATAERAQTAAELKKMQQINSKLRDTAKTTVTRTAAAAKASGRLVDGAGSVKKKVPCYQRLSVALSFTSRTVVVFTAHTLQTRCWRHRQESGTCFLLRAHSLTTAAQMLMNSLACFVFAAQEAPQDRLGTQPLYEFRQSALLTIADLLV